MTQDMPQERVLESRHYQVDLVNKVVIRGIYQHSKNKQNYRVITVSRHSEDLTWYVVYEALYENTVATIWHRPLEMFLQEVTVDGVTLPRFVYVGMYEQK